MKKWVYLISAFLIGIVVASSMGTVSAQVKSLLGKKVTGELAVVVNGQKLEEKGAVIDGKTNAPVRALANSLGAELRLENNTIYINTTNDVAKLEITDVDNGSGSTTSNKYIGGSKKSLETLRDSIKNNSIKPAMEDKEHLIKEIEELKKGGDSGTSIGLKEKELKEIEDIITKANEELRLVEEALQATE